MKKIIIIIICSILILIGYFYFTQPKLERIWVTQFRGSLHGYGGMAIGQDGRIYLAGRIPEDLGEGSASRKDYLFVARYNTEGKRDWIKGISQADWYDECTDLAIDKSGNIYVTGYADRNVTPPGIYRKKDIFVVKYDSSGSKLWERQYGSNGNDQSFGLAIDKLGNIVIVGYTEGNFEGQENIGNRDIFVMKCDLEGKAIWYKQYGTMSAEEAHDVCVDSENNIYVTGYTEGSLEYNSKAGGRDIFLMKCNSVGEQKWVKQFGSSQEDDGLAVLCSKANEIYLSGYVSDQLDNLKNFGGKDIFAAKYNTAGQKVWVKQFGSSGYDIGQDICEDDQGKMYIIGMTNGSFKKNEEQKTRWDIVLISMNSQGKLKLLKQFGTKWQDYGKGIKIDTNHNIYMAGITVGDFNNDTGEYLEGMDTFLAKYKIGK